MADSFVKMVEFRASGLDEISAKLNTVNAVQSKLAGSAREYRVALGDSVRTLRQQERLISSGAFQRRLKQTQELLRTQERLNRMIEKEVMIAKYGQMGGRAAYYGKKLGGVASLAGNTGVGALGMGIAGLQGTAPMGRLNSQFSRLSYEVGNTLTPMVDRLSNAMEKAANWMEKRSEAQQNAIGYGIGGLVAARFLGKPAMSLVGSAIANRGAIGGIASRAAWPLAAAAMAFSAVRTKYNIEESDAMEKRLNRGDLSEEKDIAMGYQGRFSGLQGQQRKDAIAKELQLMTKIESAGIDKMAGPNSGSMLGRLYDQMTFGNSGTGMLNDARQRQAVLRNMMAGGQGFTQGANDHRANARVGGQFQAMGSGYDQAYGALAESGFNTAREQAEQLKAMNDKLAVLVAAANEIRAQQGQPPLQR